METLKLQLKRFAIELCVLVLAAACYVGYVGYQDHLMVRSMYSYLISYQQAVQAQAQRQAAAAAPPVTPNPFTAPTPTPMARKGHP